MTQSLCYHFHGRQQLYLRTFLNTDCLGTHLYRIIHLLTSSTLFSFFVLPTYEVFFIFKVIYSLCPTHLLCIIKTQLCPVTVMRCNTSWRGDSSLPASLKRLWNETAELSATWVMCKLKLPHAWKMENGGKVTSVLKRFSGETQALPIRNDNKENAHWNLIQQGRVCLALREQLHLTHLLEQSRMVRELC